MARKFSNFELKEIISIFWNHVIVLIAWHRIGMLTPLPGQSLSTCSLASYPLHYLNVSRSIIENFHAAVKGVKCIFTGSICPCFSSSASVPPSICAKFVALSHPELLSVLL